MDVTVLRDIGSLLLDQIVETLMQKGVPKDTVQSFRSETLGYLSLIFSPSISKDNRSTIFIRLQGLPDRMQVKLVTLKNFSDRKLDQVFSLLEIFVGTISSIYTLFVYGDP